MDVNFAYYGSAKVFLVHVNFNSALVAEEKYYVLSLRLNCFFLNPSIFCRVKVKRESTAFLKCDQLFNISKDGKRQFIRACYESVKVSSLLPQGM